MKGSLKLICRRPLKDDVGRDFVRVPEKIMQQERINDNDYVKIKGSLSEQVIRLHPLRDEQHKVITIPSDRVEGLGVMYGDQIEISILKTSSIPLTVDPSYRADVGQNICRIHSSQMKSIGVIGGDFVEIKNLNQGSENAGRLVMRVLPFKYGEPDNRIRLNKHARLLLAVNIGDRVYGSRLILPKPRKFFWERLVGSIVGTKQLTLTVLKGEDIDEGKGIVRCHMDTLSSLGTKEGGFLRIHWLNRKITAKALKIKERSRYLEGYEDRLPLVIQLCSTERSKLLVDIYDVVEVWRDPFKIFLMSLDRLIAAVLTSIGFYLMITTQLAIKSSIALPSSIIVGILLIWVFFLRIRSEV